MILYHGTKQEKWEQIQSDGYLKNFTYFTPEIKIAQEFGDIILKIDYDISNNYIQKLSWYQYIIAPKIPIEQIERVI